MCVCTSVAVWSSRTQGREPQQLHRPGARQLASAHHGERPRPHAPSQRLRRLQRHSESHSFCGESYRGPAGKTRGTTVTSFMTFR